MYFNETAWFDEAKICFVRFNHAEGIESVEIVQVANVVSLATELDQNAVDVTISCQGRWAAMLFFSHTRCFDISAVVVITGDLVVHQLSVYFI